MFRLQSRKMSAVCSGVKMLYDVIVVGSGISGLYAALYAKKMGRKVAIVTKSNPLRSNSAVASGGINAVIDLNDMILTFSMHETP